MSNNKKARLQAHGNDEEEGNGPSPFQTLMASLANNQYSSSSSSEEEEEEMDEEQQLEEEDQDEADTASEDDDDEEEEDDMEVPETLTAKINGDEEEESSEEEENAAADDDDDNAQVEDTVHPFSKPQPTVFKVHESFECDGQEEDEKEKVYSLTGQLPSPADISANTLQIKARLKQTWAMYQEAKSTGDSLLVEKLTPLLQSYVDVTFEDRDLWNATELREMYALHVANHLFTFRDLVIRHDAKRGGDTPPQRDQGFTRPRILILLPYKSSAFRFIKLLIDLFPTKTRVKNLDRFVEEFGPGELENEEEEEEEKKAKEEENWRLFQRHCKASEMYTERDFADGTHPAMANAHRKRAADWHSCFEENAEEDFRVGLSMLSTKSLKLYSGFYESDIIIASPLGLRLATKQAMETQGDVDAADNNSAEEDEINEDEILDTKKKRPNSKKKNKDEEEDVDFLSSIELLIIDEAEVFHTQNWQHLEDVCRGLNRRPKVLRKGMDLARVYNHMLQAKQPRRRQTLVFSAYPDAQLHALVHDQCAEMNHSSVVVRPKLYQGSSLYATEGLVQRFRKTDSEARVELFAKQFIPKLLDAEGTGGTLLFVPDYLEFVRIRNLFRDAAAKRLKGEKQLSKKKRTSLFECISEYSSASKVARARSLFFHGKTRVLVITERLHYYFRYQIRGIEKLIFFAPPRHHTFYSELVNLTRDEAITFFTDMEALELERVLGTKKTKRALAQHKDTIVVCKESSGV